MYSGNDRTRQVNALQELASNITSLVGEGTAEELVGYALSEEGRDSWNIELPWWFDDHDRSLLVEFVDDNLA